MALLHGLRDNGYTGHIAVTAHTISDAEQLQQSGADQVLIPYADAAAEAVGCILDAGGQQPPGASNGSNTEEPK